LNHRHVHSPGNSRSARLDISGPSPAFGAGVVVVVTVRLCATARELALHLLLTRREVTASNLLLAICDIIVSVFLCCEKRDKAFWY
jgi:hypothetical protein